MCDVLRDFPNDGIDLIVFPIDPIFDVNKLSSYAGCNYDPITQVRTADSFYPLLQISQIRIYEGVCHQSASRMNLITRI